MAAIFDRAIFDPDIYDGGDFEFPFAGLKSTDPLLTTLKRPLDGVARHYPLENTKQTYPLGGQ